jgi:hypothetical protein
MVLLLTIVSKEKGMRLNKILIAAIVLSLFVAGAVLAGHPVKPCGIVTSPVQFTMTDKLLVATGTFKNDSRNDYYKVLIGVQFYDANGNKIESRANKYQNIKAGGTYNFKTIYTIDRPSLRNVVSAKVISVDAYID